MQQQHTHIADTHAAKSGAAAGSVTNFQRIYLSAAAAQASLADEKTESEAQTAKLEPIFCAEPASQSASHR